ncbi:unnamed protein product [Rhizoctonia solani]|uniref:Protein kinase domain-containing protein n=1 Tax=Rhizoctonia solani TaxID=456999 RepID=A0A8H3GHM7_9AGAM|nr:unnamed protein product [Rhizoctonia solani]
MVSSDGVPRIRLSLFTSSTIMDPTASSLAGTWRAPELFKSGAKFSLAGDVFALGMETVIQDESDTSAMKVWQKAIMGQPPARPTNAIPVNEAGNAIWDMLSKCWSFDPENRPSAKHVSDVMNMMFLTARDFSDGIAFKSPRLMVREHTTVQDLVAHFEKQGLINYTEFLHPSVILSSVSVADTALANVYRVEMLYHEPVAVKRVKHTTPYKRLKRAARELSCWTSHKHEHILPLFGFAVVGVDLAMVSPWMRNGCITEYVTGHPSCDRLSLCTQLTRAIAYLHEHDVVHGDIKGPNVLISDEGNVQVTDFGVSIAEHQDIEFSVTSVGGGTQRWQASMSYNNYH